VEPLRLYRGGSLTDTVVTVTIREQPAFVQRACPLCGAPNTVAVDTLPRVISCGACRAIWAVR
jgi:hypothetical protein